MTKSNTVYRLAKSSDHSGRMRAPPPRALVVILSTGKRWTREPRYRSSARLRRPRHRSCLAEKGERRHLRRVRPGSSGRFARGRRRCHEAGVGDLLRRHNGGRFSATSSVDEPLRHRGSRSSRWDRPRRPEDDLSAVMNACGEVGGAIKRGRPLPRRGGQEHVVPGTTVGAVRERLETASGLTAGAVSGSGANPEFLHRGPGARRLHASRPASSLRDRTSARCVALESCTAGFADVPLIRW